MYETTDTLLVVYYLLCLPPLMRSLGSKCVRSRMISDAMMVPATGGTNEVEPGRSRRSVHFLVVPGGQMQ